MSWRWNTWTTYLLGSPPTQDSSHHPDCCIFTKGSLQTFKLTRLTTGNAGWGGRSNLSTNFIKFLHLLIRSWHHRILYMIGHMCSSTTCSFVFPVALESNSLIVERFCKTYSQWQIPTCIASVNNTMTLWPIQLIRLNPNTHTITMNQTLRLDCKIAKIIFNLFQIIQFSTCETHLKTIKSFSNSMVPPVPEFECQRLVEDPWQGVLEAPKALVFSQQIGGGKSWGWHWLTCHQMMYGAKQNYLEIWIHNLYWFEIFLNIFRYVSV